MQWILFALLCAGLVDPAGAARRRGHQVYASPQFNPIVVAPDGNRVYVASTTSNRIDIIHARTHRWLDSVDVGIEPVSLAIRPGGHELWVSNHVSDSVSVVDIDPASPSHRQVLQTIQSTDESGVTQFDEPVGIAFAGDGSKAFVALSSRNRVAVIDAHAYQVVRFLEISAQEPRALAVRRLGDQPDSPEVLFVAVFESDNGSEMSTCPQVLPGSDQCTFTPTGIAETENNNPNLPGVEKNIIIDPERPDRDLFVFDVATEAPISGSPVTGVGTLIYGLAVGDDGRVFVSQTDARNAVNGRDADDKNGDGVANLEDLENRIFHNRVAVVDCAAGHCSGEVTQLELDAAVGSVPVPGSQLATPHGLALSTDGRFLILAAAGSSRVASLDTTTGSVVDHVDVGAIPRGVALRDNENGTHTAYVLNVLDNSVSVLRLEDATGALSVDRAGAPFQPIDVGNDPTSDTVRRGRIAFNNARASSQGTFSCASCHPDGHTDQLMWRIGGECFTAGCIPGQDLARNTMPVRGLRDTLPLHWDGALGDPFGGPNGGNEADQPPQCSSSDPLSCFRHLVDAALAGVMCEQPCNAGGELSALERDQMAAFLQSVPYPPARERRPDDVLSPGAVEGFGEFFSLDPDDARLGCARPISGCHELPLGAGTNSAVVGNFDAPTLRGMNDRTALFSIAVASTQEVLLAHGDWDPAQGPDEFASFASAVDLFFSPSFGVGPLKIFQMVQEASHGHSGAYGRQVTLNTLNTLGCPACKLSEQLATFEQAANQGVIDLRGTGLRTGDLVEVSYSPASQNYGVQFERLSREALLAEAQQGTLLATLTAHLPDEVADDSPQPLLAVPGANCDEEVSGIEDPLLPQLGAGGTQLELESRYVGELDQVFVDGINWTRRHGATIQRLAGEAACGALAIATDPIRVELRTQPGPGAHFLQLQAREGLLSNELPFFVEP